MSTDQQRYSTENQAAVIQKFAVQHGMVITRTYEDAGKSGLTIEGREALRQLLADVQQKPRSFDVILVYDVSRWGRFQDPDEPAHYEYLCKKAGAPVIYCAEQFSNDGSLSSTIMKDLKRVMAGEYSRELSVKVFAGQCRLIERGFRQGGHAGYGLRRLLIDERGEPKAELRRREHKSLQTDRVILVPGPPEEVAVVCQIYQLFVEAGLPERLIADRLNQSGLRTDLGSPWTRGTVHQVLTNEKYVGNNVFNRTSYKLQMKWVRNPPEQWVRANGVFEPIVDINLFERAGRLIAQRARRFSNEEMIALLGRLYARTGVLSGLIIDEQDDMPSSVVYRRRFGSLPRAYSLVGYKPDRDYRYISINQRLREQLPQVIASVTDRLRQVGASVTHDSTSSLVTVNDEFTLSLVIARCQSTPAGSLRWHVHFDTGLLPDISVVIRMCVDNEQVLDYYLFPHIDVALSPLKLSSNNPLSLDAYRFDTLDILYEMATRTPLRRAA